VSEYWFKTVIKNGFGFSPVHQVNEGYFLKKKRFIYVQSGLGILDFCQFGLFSLWHRHLSFSNEGHFQVQLLYLSHLTKFQLPVIILFSYFQKTTF
jgi:hypothetical protein